MKYILYIVTFMVLVLSFQGANAQETHFFDELYDVPVMEGLVVLPEEAINFDKPDGRISQSIAYAPNISWEAISLFYRESLAQMGWRVLKQNSYAREGELLDITHEKAMESSDSGVVIRFLLRPE